MKSASSALQAHLSQGQTELAYLWKIKRADGAILGFTTHDRDISYDAGDGDGPVTYFASTGFTNTATQGKSDLAVDNMEVTGFLESQSITEADIRANLYDDAIISIRLVNWADLTMGDLLLRTGTVGVVKMANGLFTAEIRSLFYKLETVIGSTYGPVCRADFGSGVNGIGMDSQWKCLIDVTLFRQTGSIALVTDSRTVVPAGELLMTGSLTPTTAAPAGWFNDGILTFTSGKLNGRVFEIKNWDGATLIFFLALVPAPAAGDTFTIEPGCDKTADNCLNKFNNIINRRAEDFIPGMDQILATPGG